MSAAGGRPTVWLAWLAWLAAGVAGVMTAVNALYSLRPDAPTIAGSLVGDVGTALALLAFSIVGALVVTRYPRLSIGWLFVGVGVVGGAGWLMMRTAAYVPAGALRDTLMWIASWSWVPWFAVLATFLPLYFPTGRLPSAAWRTLPWAAAGSGLLLWLWIAVVPGPLHYPFEHTPNPYGIEALAGIAGVGWALAYGVWGVVIVACVASVVVRYRRSRGVERQQLKWLALAAGLLALEGGLGALLDRLVGMTRAVELIGWLYPIAVAAVPAATGVAIFRYRLYEVDRLINRALVYGALSAALALTYWGGVVVLQQLLRPLTQGSELAIAASTLVVAALFQPLRSRIQSAVDRRFYRRRYDAQRTLEAFGARLREQVDLEALNAELVAAVKQTMQPARAFVTLSGRWRRRTRP